MPDDPDETTTAPAQPDAPVDVAQEQKILDVAAVAVGEAVPTADIMDTQEGTEPQVRFTPGSEVASSVGGAAIRTVPVLIEVLPTAGVDRMKVDMCVIIDISGSMGAEATIQNAQGESQSHGMSLLDIAKHGIRTLISTLGVDDRLSLVWFNHKAGVALELTSMDEDGKQAAFAKLLEMDETGGTNIWEGLETGLNSLKVDPAGSQRMGHIMLLTDGQTEMRGTVMSRLAAYKEKNETLPGTISTFGFGYNIDSALLTEISTFGDATYSFIPDCGFVGTVFVHTISNLLVTFAKDTYIAIEATNCEVLKVHGLYSSKKTGEHTRVKVGTMQYQQGRSVVVDVKLTGADSSIGANISYLTTEGSAKESTFEEVSLQKTAPSQNIRRLGPEMYRCLFVEAIVGVAQTLAVGGKTEDQEVFKNAQQRLEQFVAAVRSSQVAEDDKVKTLLEDASGQVAEAVSKHEWYWKWGVHYLPSLRFAHQTQQCNNFKDPGVQGYGGALFNRIRDYADSQFNALPPPKPSTRNSRRLSRNSAASGAASATARRSFHDMSAYNDRYGG